MAITIDGTMEQLLRRHLAEWRKADAHYNEALRQPGGLAEAALAIHECDREARPIAMLLSALVDP